ncbi:MAG: type II secretion system protein [Verrucomicrobiota bacterium]
MKKACHHNSAFSLIELVVTMVIMAIIALVTMDYLVNAGRTYTLLLAQRQADSDAMAVVQRMRREARVWRANITNTSAEWAFTTPEGATNSFKRLGETVFLNNNTLARNVQTFQLYYYNATNTTTTNLALIRRVALDLRVTNNLAASELKVNFFLREGLLK